MADAVELVRGVRIAARAEGRRGEKSRDAASTRGRAIYERYDLRAHAPRWRRAAPACPRARRALSPQESRRVSSARMSAARGTGSPRAAVMLEAFAWHVRHQPYAYRYQDAVESWPRTRPNVFLALEVTPSPRRSGAVVTESPAMRLRLLASAPARAGYAGATRTMQASLAVIDFGEVLTKTNEELDGPIRARRLDGIVNYFESSDDEARKCGHTIVPYASDEKAPA